jgi:UDP-glucuronate 4-epimerase
MATALQIHNRSLVGPFEVMQFVKTVLVTGGAGFIGSHVIQAFLAGSWRVVAVDNLDKYYDESIKIRNIDLFRPSSLFSFVHADVRDKNCFAGVFRDPPDAIVHLAAKAGVRDSCSNPNEYYSVNVDGTSTLLEHARRWQCSHFVFASSSSVYGRNTRLPWNESDDALLPTSPYGESKLQAEEVGRKYSERDGLRFIALRLFNVYGPRQRPDLAIHRFARQMMGGLAVSVMGDGNSTRDYTYVDDVVSAIRRALAYNSSLFEVINISGDNSVSVSEVVRSLADALHLVPTVEHLSPHPADSFHTRADIRKAKMLLDYRPKISFPHGIKRFVRSLELSNGGCFPSVSARHLDSSVGKGTS